MRFYVMRGQRRTGPFAIGSATDLVVRGELRATDQVSIDGKTWLPASRVKQFAEALACGAATDFDDDQAPTMLQTPFTPAAREDDAAPTMLQTPFTPAAREEPAGPAPFVPQASPRAVGPMATPDRRTKMGLWIAGGAFLFALLSACIFAAVVVSMSQSTSREAWNAPSTPAPAPAAGSSTPTPAPAAPTPAVAPTPAAPTHPTIYGCWRYSDGTWVECFYRDGSYSYSQGASSIGGRWEWSGRRTVAIRRRGRAEQRWTVTSADASTLVLQRGAATFLYTRSDSDTLGVARQAQGLYTMRGCWSVVGKPALTECYTPRGWTRARNGAALLTGTWRQSARDVLLVQMGSTVGRYRLEWSSPDLVTVTNRVSAELFERVR